MTNMVSVIIVTHDSQKFIDKCIDAVKQQSKQVEEIIVVDSGSTTRDYLKILNEHDEVVLVETDNIGFSRANNLGYNRANKDAGYFVFLNPDTFISSNFLEYAITILNKNEEVGVISGKLLGYDIDANTATGRIDSTGVFRKVYGRWYDRGQSEFENNRYNIIEEVPALCGALLFCRGTALKSLGKEIFDPDFFLYKEDIELSLRLRKKGWKLLYHPNLLAYHCRGWHTKRKNISLQKRIMAASHEILLYKKHPSPYIVWALLKYFLVKICKI